MDRIREHLLWDRSLGYAIAARLWHSISGPITLVMLIRSLTPQEQGVYYGIVNIACIQSMFELGLLNILITQTGHEMALLRRSSQSDDKSLVADFGLEQTDNQEAQRAAYRIRRLIEGSEKWFFFASLFFLLTALFVGYRVFTTADPTISWRLPLAALLAFSMVSVALSPKFAILEGAGFREDVFRSRFIQMIIGSLGVWISLGCGLGIWSLVISASIQTVMVGHFVYVEKGAFLRQFRNVFDPSDHFSWFRNIVPFQWRIAVISVVHFVATQCFTVILLNFDSTIAAGQMGMTLSVTGAIQTLALAWVQTKLAVASDHHGAGNREAAGSIWRRTAVLSTGLLVVALLVFFLGVLSLPLLERGIETRFVSPWHLAILSMGYVAYHLIAVQTYYILSRRSLPLFRAALVGTLSTAVFVWIGAFYQGTNGLVWAYFLSTIFISLPVHSVAYLSYRAKK